MSFFSSFFHFRVRIRSRAPSPSPPTRDRPRLRGAAAPPRSARALDVPEAAAGRRPPAPARPPPPTRMWTGSARPHAKVFGTPGSLIAAFAGVASGAAVSPPEEEKVAHERGRSEGAAHARRSRESLIPRRRRRDRRQGLVWP